MAGGRAAHPLEPAARNGHSSIVSDGDGRLFTMYRFGNGRERGGPWELEEVVIGLDAKTGETIWEYTYPSKLQDFNFGAGPHATPLVVGERLFTVGTNKKMHAFDTRTGKLLWAHDLVEDFNAPSLVIRAIRIDGHETTAPPHAFDLLERDSAVGVIEVVHGVDRNHEVKGVIRKGQ